MPKTRDQKEKIISELSDKIARIKSAVFTSVSGFTMDDANTLKEKGRTQGIELLIAKKTLLVRALENNGFKVVKDDFEGSVLTTLGYEDEVAPAKLMSEFAKDRDEINVVAGILEGRIVNADAVSQLATLPSREELLAKLVGSLNAPISGFVNVLAGNLRNFVYVLNAIKEAKI
jgi:large subunit ribosomal protein L10